VIHFLNRGDIIIIGDHVTNSASASGMHNSTVYKVRASTRTRASMMASAQPKHCGITPGGLIHVPGVIITISTSKHASIAGMKRE